MSALAAPGAPRARQLLLALMVPIKERIPRLRERPVRGSIGSTPFWFSDRSELGAALEVFANGEYSAPVGTPETIVDLGANAGQASMYFRRRYPASEIVAVEPDPATFLKLERNLSGDDHVVLRHCAVTPADGPVSLVREANESWRTRVAASGGGVTVAGISLERLLDDAGLETVDLLKVDIEGLEVEVLTTATCLDRVRTVIAEFHHQILDVDPEVALERIKAHGDWPHAEFIDRHLFVLRR